MAAGGCGRPPVDRVPFCPLPRGKSGFSEQQTTGEHKEDLIKYVSDNIIGKDRVFGGPFGLRKVLYLDYTASGRSLSFIEDYIRKEVLPEYGNTHTTTSVTSLQTTMYRHEARDIIRNATNASEHDAVIFVGSGTTAAVHKLIHALALQRPPIVLVGPFEHHSNLLPWREVAEQVIQIQETPNGEVDIGHLEEELEAWECCGLQLVGCFSAASNITGILCDVNAITSCLHKHHALAFWDYATAAPYADIDMNPVTAGCDQPLVYKDAVFFSPHKFIGGVSTPGVLIAKKKLFQNVVPRESGGGTVFFVRREAHRYLQEPEMKEEGGTPEIIGAIRAGLAFQLKQSIGVNVIMGLEHKLFMRASASWRKHGNLVILGSMDVPRLPIFSFLIHHPATGRFLHHNFVCAILNDLFGIQARGGCACAGPYAENLLGISEYVAEKLEELLIEDGRLDRTHLRRYREYSQGEIFRPGFTRLNFPYFLDEESMQFALDAVALVAEHGWKLLPQYMFNPETGEWQHREFQVFKDRKWLGHISYNSGSMEYKTPPLIAKDFLPENFQECLDKAQVVVDNASKYRLLLPDQTLLIDSNSEPYRWFVLPSEAQNCLYGNAPSPIPLDSLPFYSPYLKQGQVLIKGEQMKTLGTVCEFQNNLCKGDQETERVETREVDSSKILQENPIKGCSLTSMEDCLNASPDSDLVQSGEKKNEGWQFCSNRKPDFSSSLSQAVKGLVHDDMYSMSPEEFGLAVKGTSIGGCEMLDKKTECFGSAKISELTVEAACSRRPCSEETVASIIITYPTQSPVSSCGVDSSQMISENKNGGLHASGRPGATRCVRTLKEKHHGSQWFAPPKEIFSSTVKAIQDYKMIQDGDKVLVCLSGGKDSLSLLHTMRQYQFYARGKGIRFDFGAVTVDPQAPSYDPSSLKAYLVNLNLPYFYESQGILETAYNLPYECDSICSFCSRMKRGRIYACARREGYNVLALGQHLDDLTESFLMSFFHNGILRTMKASYTVQDGDLRIVRPFVYVRERELRNFAEKKKLPVIAENCPACFEAPKERHRTKQLLAAQELLFPRIYNSMLAAMKPVMGISQTGVNMQTLTAGFRSTHNSR